MSGLETEAYTVNLTHRNIRMIFDSLSESTNHNREKEKLIEDFRGFLKTIQSHIMKKMAKENIDE